MFSGRLLLLKLFTAFTKNLALTGLLICSVQTASADITLQGKPDYDIGGERGIFVWKNSFSSPISVRMNGDAAQLSYVLEIISDRPFDNVSRQNLEQNDILTVDGNHLLLTGTVQDMNDGIDLSIPVDATIIIAARFDGVAVPELIFLGVDRQIRPGTAYIADTESFAHQILPEGVLEEYLWLNYADDLSEFNSRYYGSAQKLDYSLFLAFSKSVFSAQGDNLESADNLLSEGHGGWLSGKISPSWYDGAIWAVDRASRVGIAFSVDDTFIDIVDSLPQSSPGNSPGVLLHSIAFDLSETPESKSQQGAVIATTHPGKWSVRLKGEMGTAHLRIEIESSGIISDLRLLSIENMDQVTLLDDHRLEIDFRVWGDKFDEVQFSVSDKAEINVRVIDYEGGNDTLWIGGDLWQETENEFGLSEDRTKFIPDFSRIATVQPGPSDDTWLVRQLDVETSTATRVVASINSDKGREIITFPKLSANRIEPLLGLFSDTLHSLELVFVSAKGQRSDTLLVDTIQTNSLPADFPLLKLHNSDPARMEKGYTLFRAQNVSTKKGYTMAVDSMGRVRWYSRKGGGTIQRTETGSFITAKQEIDVLGRYISRWRFTEDPAEVKEGEIQVPIPGRHHEMFLTPWNTYMTLYHSPRLVDDYPTSETDETAPRETALVIDQVIAEYEPEGSILNTWSLMDILDPTRIGYMGLGANKHVDGFDWGHANAIFYDESDNTLIASLRHQDALVKFSPLTGEPVWILGPWANWSDEFLPLLLEPIGNNFAWNYHQHAPMITSEGTFVMFDNGNFRASPFDGTEPMLQKNSYSRGVEYRVNDESKQVEQVWQYGPDEGPWIFSKFYGDADYLEETGNILLTHGAVKFTDGERHEPHGFGRFMTRIIEVDRKGANESVFDLQVYNTDPGSLGWTTYRGERIRALYPWRHVKADR